MWLQCADYYMMLLFVSWQYVCIQPPSRYVVLNLKLLYNATPMCVGRHRFPIKHVQSPHIWLLNCSHNPICSKTIAMCVSNVSQSGQLFSHSTFKKVLIDCYHRIKLKFIGLLFVTTQTPTMFNT